MNIADKILTARTALLWDQPFFGTLAMQLEVIDATGQLPYPTMATDGRCLYYHAPFVEKLSKEQLVFVIAHEVLHNAFEHHIRRQSRDPERWNRACDYAINGELVQGKVGKMPEEGLLDPRFTGLGAEEIYRLLEDEDQGGGADAKGGSKAGSGPAGDPGGCGQVLDACPQHDQAAIANARAEMQTKVKQAAAIAKALNAGTLPGGLQRLVDRLTKPVVDWRQVLRRFVDESQTRDYSWTRPNRRFIPAGLTLPGLKSDGLAHLVVAVDTSGSIDDKILVAFASEINGAFGDGAIDKITVIYADAKVHRIEEFNVGDELDLRPEGGGGTAFSDTFRWIEKHAADASCIVYFTDLAVYNFGEKPDAPVLWAVHGDSREFDSLAASVPFGEAVSIVA